MRNFICSLACFFLVLACKAQVKNAPITLISETRNGNEIYANYQDKYDDIKDIYFDRDTVTGRIGDVKINVSHPIFIKFNANMKQYPVYAKPGDTIFINTANSNRDYYRFSDGHHRTEQVEFFTRLTDAGYGIGYPDSYGMRHQTPDYIKYSGKFLKNYSKRLHLLDSLEKTARLGSDFQFFAHAVVEEQYIHALLAPYWDATHAYNLFPKTYLREVYQSGAKVHLNSHELINSSPMYRVVLKSYIRFVSRGFLDTPDEFRVSYRNATDSLKGKTRDYMLFTLMKVNINDGLTDFRQVYKHFKSTCASSEYISYVDSLLANNNGLTSKPNLLAASLESSSGEKITWRDILNKNRGNVLYLDLWASWCGPCLREIPSSKKMQDTLVGRPVRFIFITLDTDKAKWLKAIQANGLNTPGIQHYLLNSKSDLAAYLKAPLVPQHILIDRKGVTVSLNAASPSDVNALLSINRLLK